jgi:hypothetical protein
LSDDPWPAKPARADGALDREVDAARPPTLWMNVTPTEGVQCVLYAPRTAPCPFRARPAGAGRRGRWTYVHQARHQPAPVQVKRPDLAEVAQQRVKGVAPVDGADAGSLDEHGAVLDPRAAVAGDDVAVGE